MSLRSILNACVRSIYVTSFRLFPFGQLSILGCGASDFSEPLDCSQCLCKVHSESQDTCIVRLLRTSGKLTKVNISGFLENVNFFGLSAWNKEFFMS